MSTRRMATAAFFLITAACASNPSPSSNAGSAAPAKNADVITAEELADPAVAASDALEAVRRLRPRFLMTRGAVSGTNAAAGDVHISVDGGPLLTVDNLSRFRPSQIVEIRYLNSTDAAQRFGTNAGSGGVILVKSK